ncbi:MAG: hypothetical protein GTO13_02305 [Proteobacteria bacterium]|nr:hypothetical protein [Pseudomonadota bacterium]
MRLPSRKPSIPSLRALRERSSRLIAFCSALRSLFSKILVYLESGLVQICPLVCCWGQKVIYLFLPAGPTVDRVLGDLLCYLDRGDVVMDGGNSFYLDSIRREREMLEKGLYFLDVGTSGGIEGARNGACFMVGGRGEGVGERFQAGAGGHPGDYSHRHGLTVSYSLISNRTDIDIHYVRTCLAFGWGKPILRHPTTTKPHKPS